MSAICLNYLSLAGAVTTIFYNPCIIRVEKVRKKNVEMMYASFKPVQAKTITSRFNKFI